MTLEQLRLKHPRLVYKKYDIVIDGKNIVITYEFILEPDIVFQPTVSIPRQGDVDTTSLSPYAFNLGLVEAISYWKCACPREFVVEAGPLTSEHIRFWYDLFIHGLGEFFYRNDIDFTKPDFLKITPSVIPDPTPAFAGTDPVYNTLDSRLPAQAGVRGNDNISDLVLVGGGKDSAVTLGILSKSDRTLQTMIVNPTKAARSNIKVAGLVDPIIVKRTIDPKLLEINAAGYLNGHTPFSSYLAFLGVMVGFLYGNEHVIVSNEKSANEGNVVYHGMEVNHQYSKSFRFEQLFRKYCNNFLTRHSREGGNPGENWTPDQVGGDKKCPSYFSFLRPLDDVQISTLFVGFPKFFSTFRSCNVGSSTNIWCGACPKCAFTYLIVFLFVPYQPMLQIFSRDYLADPVILSYIKELVGLTPVKPFECVGSRDEAKLAVYLSVKKYVAEGVEIPEGLLKIKSDLQLTEADIARLKEDVMNNWGDTYNLPEEYMAILKNAWSTIKES